MLQRTRWLLAVVLLLLLGGCDTLTSTTGPAAPSVAPPASGKAAITGQIVSNANQAPINQVLVRLAPLFTNEDTGDAAFALDVANAPAATSDANGFFTITDVDPKKYVIVVGDDLGVYDIVADQNMLARAYELMPDKVVDAGTLAVRPDVTKAP